MAVKYRSGVGQYACRFMSTDTRPSLGRHIGQVSVDISAECRSSYRPIVSTDTRSTDVLSTHDPLILYISMYSFLMAEEQKKQKINVFLTCSWESKHKCAGGFRSHGLCKV